MERRNPGLWPKGRVGLDITCADPGYGWQTPKLPDFSRQRSIRATSLRIRLNVLEGLFWVLHTQAGTGTAVTFSFADSDYKNSPGTDLLDTANVTERVSLNKTKGQVIS